MSETIKKTYSSENMTSPFLFRFHEKNKEQPKSKTKSKLKLKWRIPLICSFTEEDTLNDTYDTQNNRGSSKNEASCIEWEHSPSSNSSEVGKCNCITHDHLAYETNQITPHEQLHDGNTCHTCLGRDDEETLDDRWSSITPLPLPPSPYSPDYVESYQTRNNNDGDTTNFDANFYHARKYEQERCSHFSTEDPNQNIQSQLIINRYNGDESKDVRGVGAWHKYWDPTNQAYYYFNEMTQESIWDDLPSPPNMIAPTSERYGLVDTYANLEQAKYDTNHTYNHIDYNSSDNCRENNLEGLPSLGGYKDHLSISIPKRDENIDKIFNTFHSSLLPSPPPPSPSEKNKNKLDFGLEDQQRKINKIQEIFPCSREDSERALTKYNYNLDKSIEFLLKQSQANESQNKQNSPSNESHVILNCKKRSSSHAKDQPYDMLSIHDFECSITMETMKDPVIAADGHTYERGAMEEWLSKNNTSPITNEILGHKLLTPNRILQSIIKRRNEEDFSFKDE